VKLSLYVAQQSRNLCTSKQTGRGFEKIKKKKNKVINSDQKNNLHIQHTRWLEVLDTFFSAAFFSQICHRTMGYTYFGTY
jgi:hypothetical protein